MQILASEITKVKTVEELERVCSRLTDTVENDLKKRLFVYREDKDKWHAGKHASMQNRRSSASTST